MARRKSRKCRFGKVKTGPRKGRCRKRKLSGAAARRGKKRRSKKDITLSSGKCRWGKVSQGPRKGKCLKNKRCRPLKRRRRR